MPGVKHLAHEESPEQFVAIVQRHLREMAGISGLWEAMKREPVGYASA